MKFKNKLKIFYEKYGKLIRSVIILLIIITSIILYLPSLNENSIKIEQSNCCNLSFKYEGVFEESGFWNMLRKVTSPFDLKYVDAYLSFSLKENQSCYVAYPEILAYKIENETKNLTRGDILIKQIKTGMRYEIELINFTYMFTPLEDLVKARNISFPERQFVSSARTNFTVGEEVNYYLTAKMNVWDAIGNIFIFSAFWIGIILLFKETIKWIKG